MEADRDLSQYDMSSINDYYTDESRKSIGEANVGKSTKYLFFVNYLQPIILYASTPEEAFIVGREFFSKAYMIHPETEILVFDGTNVYTDVYGGEAKHRLHES